MRRRTSNGMAATSCAVLHIQLSTALRIGILGRSSVITRAEASGGEKPLAHRHCGILPRCSQGVDDVREGCQYEIDGESETGIGCQCKVVTHSRRGGTIGGRSFESRSCVGKTGCVDLPLLPLYHATESTSLPPAYFSGFPPLRAAYSHSASVGRRNVPPLLLSFWINSFASFQNTVSTG
jgi:hypothetical protein